MRENIFKTLVGSNEEACELAFELYTGGEEYEFTGDVEPIDNPSYSNAIACEGKSKGK